MARTTSYSLSPRLDAFVKAQVRSGEHRSASDVLRAALTTMADEKRKESAVLAALDEGLASGTARPGVWKRARTAIRKQTRTKR